MAKNEAKTEEETNKVEFDLIKEMEQCPKPEWYKRAFLRCVDASKIKSRADLGKQFKKFEEAN